MHTRLTQTKTALYMQAIGVGLLLGLVELLLLLLGAQRLGWRLSLSVGLLFYLLIPLLVGLRTARQSEKTVRGLVADWLTGAVAYLVFLFPFLLNLLTSAHPPAAAHHMARADVAALSFAAVATVLALLFTSLGILFAIAGGACGRAMGKRRKTRVVRSCRHVLCD